MAIKSQLNVIEHWLKSVVLVEEYIAMWIKYIALRNTQTATVVLDDHRDDKWIRNERPREINKRQQCTLSPRRGPRMKMYTVNTEYTDILNNIFFSYEYDDTNSLFW